MNIYITLDYELFVNDNTGDVEHCLLIPSNEFMDVCDKYGVKTTFFVDAAYLYRLDEFKDQYASLNKDLELVSQQIRNMVKRGHKVALHIHSQWYYANFDGSHWQMDFEHYKLSDMPQEKADELLIKSLNLLKEISGQPIDSFRAGGYSIQTYKSFPELFLANGINKDSSALCGEKLVSALHVYDYSKVKTGKCYSFDKEVAVKDENGCMREYPISTFKVSFLKYCLSRIKNNRTPDNVVWGNGGDKQTKKVAAFIKHLLTKMFKGVNCFATFDYPNCYDMEFWSRYIDDNSIEDLIIITHPKWLSTLSIKNLDVFLQKYHKNHNFSSI